MVRGMSDQLRSGCSNVVSSAQGLPGTVQEQITNARQSAEELYASLGSTSSITPIILERSRHHLTQVQSIFMLPAFNLPAILLIFGMFLLCVCVFPLGATVSGWRHGVPAPQHATQLAGGTLRPPDHRESRGTHGDGAERPTQLEPAEPVYSLQPWLTTVHVPVPSA